MLVKKKDISEILLHLDTPVTFLSGKQAEEILNNSNISKNSIFSYHGKVFLAEGSGVYCTEDHPGASDILRMLRILIHDDENITPQTTEDAIRQLLSEEINEDEKQRLIGKFGLRLTGCFRLIVFKAEEGRRSENAYDELLPIFPLEERDITVRINNREFVLIRDCGKDETADDLVEYCLALCDTAESEADIRLKAGISASVASPLEFCKAYSQGQEAIEVATRFSRIGPVWIYEKLLLEQFLNDIPASVYEEMKARVMTDEVRKLLTGEMLETVNMFFKCDLNLSDTARQMFVHRNTLMYRLDKIQKVTGLDLRRFYDAVVFRIIMELP